MQIFKICYATLQPLALTSLIPSFIKIRQKLSEKKLIRLVMHTLYTVIQKNRPPNTLSYNAIISQYSFNKFYEMFEEVKDCKE